MKKKVKVNNNQMRSEYDFSKMKGGVRGKYFDRYRSGTNLIHLAPDVARVFHTDDLVNEALRSLIRIAKSGALRAQ